MDKEKQNENLFEDYNLKLDFYSLRLKELIFGSLVGVSYTYRFSGSKKIRNENIAEHSYYVAIIAGALAKYENEMIEKFGDVNNIKQVDLLKVYEFSLFHDVEEICTSDMLHTFKAAMNRKTKEEVDKVIDFLFEEEVADIFIGDKIYDIWKNSHVKNKPEYLFLKLGDWLQLLQYINEEEKLGNTNFKDIKNRGYKLILSLTDYPVYKDYYVIKLIKHLINNLKSNL